MKRHWPEYLIEAAGLGLFMISASSFAVLLFHPASPLAGTIPDGFHRDALMGLAMALTCAALVHNRWGKQSGAHFNPAFTLAFLHLGKVASRDAAAYVIAQFAGGASGMLFASAAFSRWLGHPAVNYVATLPGKRGAGIAWVAEFAMAFSMMSVVLVVSSVPRIARFTGLGASMCVFLFITFESPLSGMSLNPARTFASALVADNWSALWVYFTAPLAGTLAAATVSRRFLKRTGVTCAKIHHQNRYRCIFCEFQKAQVRAE